MKFIEDLIRNSKAPARVRMSFDKLISAGCDLTLRVGLLDKLAKIFEVSRFAADVIRSYDDAWNILDKSSYSSSVNNLSDHELLRKDLALSMFYVIAADVLQFVPFEDTLKIISDSADRSLEAAWRIARDEMIQKYGKPEGYSENREGFTILGMGKLGGRELNFSSDIDLVFIYRNDGESSAGSRGRLSNAEWYSRVSERIIELLSSKLLGNFTYRVDMRLRPEGRNSPLVRSLDSTLLHYESAGEAWERQAFIRARSCAGDLELGKSFLKKIIPFIYKRFLDRDAVLEIESIKRKIESKTVEEGHRNVKLSAGGIREIEFIVQILQLANGGRCEEVRTASTLEALERLVEKNYIMDSDRDFLRESYIFLRRIEHRLQMLDGRQTHLLPSDSAEMDSLAIGLGFSSGEELWEKYLNTAMRVREFYESRFSRSKQISLTELEMQVMKILDSNSELESNSEELFSATAAKEIRNMAKSGNSDFQSSSATLAFMRSVPVWLPMMQKLPAIDDSLKRLSRIVERYGAKIALYEIITSHPAVAEILVNITSLSEHLSNLIYKDPSSLEALLSPGGVTGEREISFLRERFQSFNNVISNSVRSGIAIRVEEELRIGVRFILAMADARRTGIELSNIAELLLGEHDFAIAALGRFGSRDIGFTSDLDIVFVTDALDETIVKSIQNLMEQWQKTGLKIDTRLRPYGRTAPLVVGTKALSDYFEKDAAVWERIAWARARVISKNVELKQKVEDTIRSFLFEKSFGRKELLEVIRMRKKLLNESSSDDDIKRGRGGSIDIDFLCSVRKIMSHSESIEPEILLKDKPELIAAFRYLRLLDMSAQIVTGKSFRGNESRSDTERIEIIMERHGQRLNELGAYRKKIEEIEMNDDVEKIISEMKNKINV